MTRTLRFVAVASLVFVNLGGPASAQNAPIDGTSFAELSLKAIALVNQADRRGARNLFSQQLALIPSVTRVKATDRLFEQLRTDDTKLRNDIFGVLGLTPARWATSDTTTDTKYIYKVLLETTDDVSKDLLERALSNARGLYRDGIGDFNSSSLQEFRAAEAKFRKTFQEFPKSRYAENASFYLGQYFTKAYLLTEPRNSSLVSESNKAYEDYIAKAEAGAFGDKPDFVAAAYYYRGLNGWLVGNLEDSRNWLTKGQKKTSDDDRVYVYQLFYNGNREKIVDRFLTSKNLFSTTLAFIGQTPSPGYERFVELTAKIRQ